MSDPKLTEAVRIVREQTIPALAGSGGGGHVAALGAVLAALEQAQAYAARGWSEAVAVGDIARDELRRSAELGTLAAERGAALALARDVAGGAQQRVADLEAALLDAAHQEALDTEALGRLEDERYALRAEVERVKMLLGKAAQEIHCAGPVDHRIRVLRREHADLVLRLADRAERAEAALRAKCDEYKMHDPGFCNSGACDLARAALRDPAPAEEDPGLLKLAAQCAPAEEPKP